MLQDIRFAIRSVVRNPGFSLGVVLTLALGIGVNTAVFSLVDGILLRPLPFSDSERLVRVWGSDPQRGATHLEVSYQEFEAFRDQCRTLAQMTAFSIAPRALSDSRERPSRLTIARISQGFFQLLGVAPERGRAFDSEDYRRSAPIVILSHELWLSRYGGDPSILGQDIFLRGQAHSVVGVMPAGFAYPPEARLWRPLTAAEMEDDDPEFFLLGRLAEGATVEQSSQEVAAIAQSLPASDPDESGPRGAWVQSMHAMIVSDIRRPLILMMAAVGLVLLIACGNAANLMLSRSSVRLSEMAVRSAFGAQRARLARQCFTESLLLAALAAALGLALGFLGLRILQALGPGDIPRLQEVSLDLRVAAFMIGLSALAGILFGTAPALTYSRPDLRNRLEWGGRSSSGSPRRRLQSGLIVAEVALAMLLAASASLLFASFRNHLDFERGFAQLNVLVIPIGQSPRVLDTTRKREDFYARVLEEAESFPQVTSASLSSISPMQPQGFNFPFRLATSAGDESASSRTAYLRIASPGFFDTAGIDILAGRGLDREDRADAPPIAVVNQAFVHSFLPSGDPLRQRLLLPPLGRQQEWREVHIAGVAADLKPSVETEARPAFYLPFSQMPWYRMHLLVRSSEAPSQLASAMRQRIWAIAPNVTLDNVHTLRQVVDLSVAAPRFHLFLSAIFAGLSLLLAAVGIYGVLSYAAARRRRELAIREALGARRSRLAATIVGQGMRLTAWGLLLGTAASLAAARWMDSLLYEVSPSDPFALVAAAAALALTALAACLGPASSALRSDTAETLRSG